MSARDALVLALDQGTSSTKALLVDSAGTVVGRASVPVGLDVPRPGEVEQDADELWSSVQEAAAAVLDAEPANAGRVAAVGLSNQRESMLVWERSSGRPLGPMLTWQDSRTTALAAELAATGINEMVQQVSGLPLDPMFSALRARWLLDAYDPDRRRAHGGELCLGTVDSWLLSRLGGEHVTEVGNASRTQLLAVDTGAWDDRLLDAFDVPRQALPTVLPSTGPFPRTQGLGPVPDGVPVLAVMGDSHAALFAHAGWRAGVVKATYGTGSSVMGLAQQAGGDVAAGLCRTIAWDVDGRALALEGNIRSSGQTLQFLAELFEIPVETLLGEAVKADPEGVHLVPAFTGLGAPWWEPEATAVVTGLSLGSRRPQLARAALEAVAFQVEDVVEAMAAVIGPVGEMRADGGLTREHALLQLQADLGGRRVVGCNEPDLSALGVADLAGIGAGLWTRADLEARDRRDTVATPATSDSDRQERLAGWRGAVSRSRRSTGDRP